MYLIPKKYIDHSLNLNTNMYLQTWDQKVNPTKGSLWSYNREKSQTRLSRRKKKVLATSLYQALLLFMLHQYASLLFLFPTLTECWVTVHCRNMNQKLETNLLLGRQVWWYKTQQSLIHFNFPSFLFHLISKLYFNWKNNLQQNNCASCMHV